LIPVLIALAAVSSAQTRFTYVSPVPGSSSAHPSNYILLKTDAPIVLDAEAPSVRGSASGEIAGTWELAEGGVTLRFAPNAPYQYGETITVSVEGARTTTGEEIADTTFSFRTRLAPGDQTPRVPDFVLDEPRGFAATAIAKADTAESVRMIGDLSVPADYPDVRVLRRDPDAELADGMIFLANIYSTRYFIAVVNNLGEPQFYRRMPFRPFDFKPQPGGLFSVFQYTQTPYYLVMDSTFAVIDTVTSPYGYQTDEHELLIDEQGARWMIGIDKYTYDMSQVVSGGNPNATVADEVIFKLDEDNQPLYEWRVSDHMNFEDAVGVYLTSSFIDPFHVNSIDFDADSNVVISARNQSQCMLFDRETGEPIWRLNGAGASFAWANEPTPFSWQHDIRPTTPGRFTIFDNGAKRTPQFSRVVEYELDTTTMTATKVWEYRHAPDRFARIMGNSRRLPNGNTSVCWSQEGLPKYSEIDTTGEIVFEMDYVYPQWTYRSFRAPFSGAAIAPELYAENMNDQPVLIFNQFGDPNVVAYRVYGGTSPAPDSLLAETTNPYHELAGIRDDVTYYFRVTSVDSSGVESGFSNEATLATKLAALGEERLLNGDFSEGLYRWSVTTETGASATVTVEDSTLTADIANAGARSADILLEQSGLALEAGKEYRFEAEARADEQRIVRAKVGQIIHYSLSEFMNYGMVLDSSWKILDYTFTMENHSVVDGLLRIELGGNDANVQFRRLSFVEIEPTGVADRSDAPRRFELRANYPNPFNPVTTISFALPARARARVEIFNALGERVETLHDAPLEAGERRFLWNAADRPSGVYILRVTAGEQSDAIKMLLLK
jgi:hypothetical protein